MLLMDPPRKTFFSKLLVRGGEPVLVNDRTATHSLKQWDRIAARVVQVGTRTQITGAVLPYDRDASETLLKLLRNISKQAAKEKRKLADLADRDVNDLTVANTFSQTALLRALAPTITTVWLTDIINRAADPQIPEVRNVEGDILLFCTVNYPFATGTTTAAIRLALGQCSELRQENATFWNWFKPRTPAKTLGVQKPRSKSQSFITTLEDGSLVLGGVELRDKALVLSVNSRERSDRGRELLSKTLGGLVGQPLVEMQTVEQVMESRASPPSEKLDLSEEQQRSIIHDSMDRHYRNLIDQPIPVLGNKSPRAAAKTAKGRAKVVDWLKMLENHMAKSGSHNDEMASYSFNWLWSELGLNDLRR
jgi:hypothetical protein